MPRGKKFTAEQIIGKLREAEVGLAQGKTVPEVSFGASKPATHRRVKPATRWGVLDGRILFFGLVCKGAGSVRSGGIGGIGRR